MGAARGIGAATGAAVATGAAGYPAGTAPDGYGEATGGADGCPAYGMDSTATPRSGRHP
jgi:hypothetical protein